MTFGIYRKKCLSGDSRRYHQGCQLSRIERESLAWTLFLPLLCQACKISHIVFFFFFALCFLKLKTDTQFDGRRRKKVLVFSPQENLKSWQPLYHIILFVYVLSSLFWWNQIERWFLKRSKKKQSLSSKIAEISHQTTHNEEVSQTETTVHSNSIHSRHIYWISILHHIELPSAVSSGKSH